MSTNIEKAKDQALRAIKEKGQELDDVEYAEYLSELIYELVVKHDDFKLGSQQR